jgi:hypothetical protein
MLLCRDKDLVSEEIRAAQQLLLIEADGEELKDESG